MSAGLFSSFAQRGLALHNRIVMSPMCMYSCLKEDGVPHDFHLVHLGSRATGKLAHAGRKHEGTDPLVAPSALSWSDRYRVPEALDLAGIDRVVKAFGDAAKRSREIVGCDMVEIHAAHGYLLHEFLSPLSNHRTDEYGGSLENRVRLLKRVYDAVRQNFGEDRAVWVRISCTDWVDSSSWNIEEAVQISRLMKEWGVDLVDCSSGGNSPAQQIPVRPLYQAPFAERIRRDVGIPTGAVGLITEAKQAEGIVREGQADVVLLARELLRNPYFALEAGAELGVEGLTWPTQYLRAKPHPHTHAAAGQK